MKPIDTIYSIMESLQIADTNLVAEIAQAQGLWTDSKNPYANVYKYLRQLVDLGKLSKGDGFFRTLSCKSEYGEHARLLSFSIGEVLKTNIESVIFREKTIQEVGLRPDAMVLLKQEGKGRCFVLEVVNNELPMFLDQKRNAWASWQDDLSYLSELFGFKIPHYDFITSEQLTQYLEAL